MIKQYLQTSWNNTETAKAYVLLNVIQGLENQVVDAARGLGSLKKACCCFGMYDLILEIEASSFEVLKELITQKYRKIIGVQSTLVLLITGTVRDANINEEKKKLKIIA